MDLMREYPDKYFDLAIVDPPYGIGAENHAGNTDNGWTQWKYKSWDSETPSPEYFIELFRVSKNQIVWGGNYMTTYLPPSQCWIFWDKGQRNFSLADGELAWTSFKKSLRVFEMSRSKATLSHGENKIHPTQKPVQLYQYLLDNYASTTDKILDTHLGSGSIAIACHYFGCDLTASEIDKEYYDAAMKRIELCTRQIKMF